MSDLVMHCATPATNTVGESVRRPGRRRALAAGVLAVVDAALGLDLEQWGDGAAGRGLRATLRSRKRRAATATGVALVALAWWSVTHVSVVLGLSATVLLWGTEAAAALSWRAVVCLVAVSALHYVAAAVSARAAAGVRMPFGELLATQFAAAAANRITPAGLGGATVLGRYFARRGRLRGPEAAAAVSSLAVVGAIADVAAFAALVGLGMLLGVSGAGTEVPLLLTRLVRLVPISGGGWYWLAAGTAVAVIVAWVLVSRSGAAHRTADAVVSYLRAARMLLRRPARVATVMLSSATTTLLLAVGFAAAATVSSNGLPVTAFGALMIGYMVAAAAGNALPTPGGIGAVDAALTGVLIAAGLHASGAVGIVLVFRLITFWSPAVIGIGLLPPLRRRGAF